MSEARKGNSGNTLVTGTTSNTGRSATVDRGRVRREMAERDARDSERDVAPLAAAPDAIVLDTSELDADAAFAAALAAISGSAHTL